VGAFEGLQPDRPLGKLHVDRLMLKSEFQDVFPVAERQKTPEYFRLEDVQVETAQCSNDDGRGDPRSVAISTALRIETDPGRATDW